MISLFLAMVIWGTVGVFALWSGLSAMEIAFYRCVIGAAFSGAYLILSRQSFQLNKMVGLVALAGICLVLNWVFLFRSFQVSSITVGNISYYLQPMILMVLGFFSYGEKIRPGQWFLMGLALLGVILTVDIHTLLADIATGKASNTLLGVLLGVLAALFYSFLVLIMKPVVLSSAKILFIQMAVGSLFLIPWVKFSIPNLVSGANVLCLGLCHTVLAFVLYYQGIRTTKLSIVAAASYIDPVVAIFCDVMLFQKQLSALQILGIMLTIFAAYSLVAFKDIRNQQVLPSPA